MAAQSALKLYSSCKGGFTSYQQHLPFAAGPQAKVPFLSLITLALNSHGFERHPQSSEICVASKSRRTMTRFQRSPHATLHAISGCIPLQARAAPVASIPTRPPISGLPIELMIVIFQYACDDIEYWLTALSLPLVSREWRSITHALSELWTHIALGAKHPGRLEIVWWYLHLSRDAPLDVIDLLGDGEFGEPAGLLVNNATRWRWADIWCPSEDLPIFKGINKLGVSMLESIKFDVASRGSDVAFRDAPRLREYAPGGVRWTRNHEPEHGK
ncbi:hypothetical protein BDZ89DRAFT_1200434 [Hymenopellis radicata]|nr:hypothetical protein BDZ89DRAFT_1200434 [Hymenopellis radicata]